MKFGIALPNFGMYAKRDVILGMAVAAEELGFDSLWVSDHILIPDSHKGFGSVFFEPLVTLAQVASCTSRVLLGTSVIILPYRNPIVLAKTVSTLDVLSNGRIIFGVGTGWLREEFHALGVSYEERGAITDEGIEIIRSLWTLEKPSFKGRYYGFSNIGFLPKPVQKPHPPIWIGGNSKRAVERAANLGDGWHPVGLVPEEIREKSEYADGILKKKKRDRDFVISLRKNLQLTDGEKKGAVDERELLRGTPDKIAKGIERYKESGVSHLVFQILSGTLEGVFKTMEVFSRDIRPSLGL